MSLPPKWSKVPPDAAAPWARECLSQGSAVAERLTRALGRFTVAEVLLPGDWDSPVEPLNAVGRGMRLGDAGPAVAARLGGLLPEGAATFVEDELRYPGDPALVDEHLVAEGRILHVVERPQDTWSAVSGWSSGYPLIAYAASAGWPWGRPPLRRELDGPEIEALARRIDVVLLGVFDFESVVLLSTALGRSTRHRERR